MMSPEQNPDSRWCSLCRENHGYRRVKQPDGQGGYYEALTVCTHPERQRAHAFEPAGEIVHRSSFIVHRFHVSQLFAARPKLRDCFDANDLMIAELILGHVGEASAIQISEISQTLWPEIYNQGDAAQSNLERTIKAVVSKLRRRPISLRIISNRRKPYGYYMAATPQEWLAYRAEMWKHTRSWLELLHETGEDTWLEEQLGQLRLAWTNQSTDSAEVNR